MKRGSYDEQALEHQLNSRGLMNRYLGRLTRTVTKPQQIYPIGVLFGLGFDTATEVALLVLAGGAAGALGFMILGMFVATRALAVTVWRYGRIEERWSAHLPQGEASA